jgi:hypothetical protein
MSCTTTPNMPNTDHKHFCQVSIQSDVRGRPGVWEIILFSVSSRIYDHLCVWKFPLNSKLLGDKDCLNRIWPVTKWLLFLLPFHSCAPSAGLTKPGKVGEIIALYRLKSISLDYKAKLKLTCFFLQVTLFLQIFFVLW